MKTPAIITGMLHRLGRKTLAGDKSGYHVFTQAYDEVVYADNLFKALPRQRSDPTTTFQQAVARFESEFLAERISIAASGAELVRQLTDAIAVNERAKTVVSFLIDHSGSMKGLRMLSAMIAVEGAVDALGHAGISTEVLGFTTVNWKGGRSRAAWRWAGRPRNPGRLCDLRHIVYKDAGPSNAMPWSFRHALRPELLRENVDGEALAWAAARLHAPLWRKRIICVISDGAPVDDSTLAANADATILTRHLSLTEANLRAEGVVIGFLQLGREHVREPQLHERADEPEGAGLALLKLARRALLEAFTDDVERVRGYEVVRRFERSNGQEAITIESDGKHGRYVLWHWFNADTADEYGEDYWSPVLWSGLYSGPDEAGADAMAEFSWLRESRT